MAKSLVKVNRKGITGLLNQPGVSAQVKAAADRIAVSVENNTGVIHGYPVRVWTDVGQNRQSPPRPRAAVIATHPTPKGRKNARRSLGATTSTLFGSDAKVRS